MKRQPTEVVALVLHGCTLVVSALMYFRARHVLALLRELGAALPALTQFLYDIHLPTVLCVVLAASFATALLSRGTASFFVSSAALTLAVVSLTIIWWALRLPFMPL